MGMAKSYNSKLGLNQRHHPPFTEICARRAVKRLAAPPSSISFSSSIGFRFESQSSASRRRQLIMSVLSSVAARKKGHVKAVILGDSLASDDDDLILPSHDFSHQALVPSLDHVSFFLSFYPLSLCFFFFLLLLFFFFLLRFLLNNCDCEFVIFIFLTCQTALLAHLSLL